MSRLNARLGSRPGVTLVEVLVAVGLASLVCAAAAAALLKVERSRRASRAERDGRLVLRDGAMVLRSELQGVAAESVRVWGDTAVSFLGLVGVGVVCARTDSALVLPPASATSGLPFTAWRSPAEPGDVVAAVEGDSAGNRAWARIVSVDAPRDAAGCSPATGFVSPLDSASRRPVVRVRLDRAMSSLVAVGAPLQVVRRGRFVLHRGADRSWSLAYRRCDDLGSCGAAQPVAGPLASAAEAGLGFSLRADPSRLDVVLRAVGETAVPARESLRTVIGLRNAPAP